MNLAREGFELRPERLLAAHLPQEMIAGVERAKICHPREELEKTLDGVGVTVGLLPDLDDACRLLVYQDRRQENDEVARVACGLFAIAVLAGTGVRRQMDGPALLKRLPQQFV